ncbi:MAG: relaxase/mobilization nuclease domain-containing protein [Lachnospiraceae bacterium]|nr:relaxase/mobilization nuclease domain-containing protein [Lachnospiraceae bacterium]
MANGIVVKVWNIKEGSGKRGAGVQISDSISYITDEEKVDLRLSDTGFSQIGREVTYVTNDVKTLQGALVGCKHILDIKSASAEMMQVKVFYDKTGGRVALHGIISVDESESARENAGKLMMLASDLLDEVFADHQAVYAVHMNTENLHVHFIINTVGLYGRKIHMDKGFMSSVLEPALNRLAEKYGFTPNAEWKKQKKMDQTSFAKRVIQLRRAVDEAIERSDDYEAFLSDLRSKGIVAESGRHLSLKMEGMTRAIRSHRLGSMYTQQAIAERILKKREELARVLVGDHTKDAGIGPGAYFTADPLKKYKDMTKEEKQRAVQLLRAGRNPWRERKNTNWQLERMADEFQRTGNVYQLIRIFAPETKSGQEALSKITDRLKDLATQKKAVRDRLREYKPITDLYEEAKRYETKAYLYEFAGADEYLGDYLAYQKICNRLLEGYSKTIDEVASFVEEEKGQILYAAAQAKELASVQRTIRRFLEGELSESIGAYTSLFEAVGFSNAKSRAQLYGVFESSIRYIAADGCTGGYIRAVIMPDEKDGKRTERADITVFDENGKEARSFSSKDMSTKDFNTALHELKSEMGLYRCHSFDTKEQARQFMQQQRSEKPRRQRPSE